MALIDVVKFNGIPNKKWLVYRYPRDNFVTSTQLIVGEGQVAVFVKGGKAMDYFTAGTYTLSTNNIPLLQSVINLPFGGKTPFTAEIYFINKTVKLDMLWGTSDPISLIDPKYNIRMRVRAFGQFGIKISDYRVFLTEIIGALDEYEVVKFDAVMSYFKGMLITKVKTLISGIIIGDGISVLEITPKLDEISKRCENNIFGEFDRFGLEVINFYINSINFPNEDFDRINKILEEKAAFEIIGDSRYNVKRSFDVMEASANNENGGGIAAAGIGLGVGAGAGIAVAQNFTQSAGNIISTQVKTIKCNKCGKELPNDSKFCMNCGSKLEEEKNICYSCNAEVLKGAKFCPNCGALLAKKICPSCGKENNPDSRFCSECGGKMGE